MFRCNHHPQGAHYFSLLKYHLLLIGCFNKCDFSKLNCALPEDGDYTETCCSCFNVNFNTPFKKLVHQLV